MPLHIDTAWLATLVDDSGPGDDGSPWDVDDVNKLIAGEAVSTEQTTTATGTQHDFSLSGARTYLRCNNASALVLTGFSVAGATPPAGARVIIDNVGTSTVKVDHQNTGSTAAYRAIAVSTQGQIVGAGGRIEGVYDATTDRWRIACVDPGAPIAVTFSAGNFTGNGSMTWTVGAGDQGTFQYTQRGKLLRVALQVVSSTVGGTPNTHLQVAIPGGFTAGGTCRVGCSLLDNSIADIGVAGVTSSTTVIYVMLRAGGNWAASTDGTHVYFSFEFEVA